MQSVIPSKLPSPQHPKRCELYSKWRHLISPSRSLAIILSMLSLSVSPTLPPCPNTLFSMLLLCWSVTSLALVLGDVTAGEMNSEYFILLKWVKSSDLDSINQSCNQMGDRGSVFTLRIRLKSHMHKITNFHICTYGHTMQWGHTKTKSWNHQYLNLSVCEAWDCDKNWHIFSRLPSP